MTILFGWDLNLTLEEGSHLIIWEFMNRQAKRDGYNQVTIDQVLDLYGHPLDEFYRNLFGVEDPLLTTLREEGEQISSTLYPLMKLTPHAQQVLEWIAEAGHDSVIASHTTHTEVEKMVDHLEIGHLLTAFNGVPGNPKNFDSKSSILRHQMAKAEYDRVIMIGDSTQDIEAGIEVGATTYLFQPPCKYSFPYEQGKADHLIADLRDIVRNEIPVGNL
jgi:phosphoglycolate phosphatase-like HAD superfamily hydrolase